MKFPCASYKLIHSALRQQLLFFRICAYFLYVTHDGWSYTRTLQKHHIHFTLRLSFIILPDSDSPLRSPSRPLQSPSPPRPVELHGRAFLERCFVFGLPVLYEKQYKQLSLLSSRSTLHQPSLTFLKPSVSLWVSVSCCIYEALFKPRPPPPQPITRGVSKPTASADSNRKHAVFT